MSEKFTLKELSKVCGDIESVKDKMWQADPNSERSTPICQFAKAQERCLGNKVLLVSFIQKLKYFVLHVSNVLNYRMTTKH